jgi:hypothetical protein
MILGSHGSAERPQKIETIAFHLIIPYQKTFVNRLQPILTVPNMKNPEENPRGE